MTVVRDPSPGVFLEQAGPLLYAKEAEYGLPLGLAEALQTSEPRRQAASA
jgi:hypothetical protein